MDRNDCLEWIDVHDRMPPYNVEVRLLIGDYDGQMAEDGMLFQEDLEPEGTARGWKVRGFTRPWKVTDSRVLAWHMELPIPDRFIGR